MTAAQFTELVQRIETVIEDFEMKAAQLAYIAGLPAEVQLLDPDVDQPLPKLSKKRQRDTAKAYRKILIKAAEKLETILENLTGKGSVDIEAEVEQVNTFIEQQVEITQHIHFPLPPLRARIISASPSSLLGQKEQSLSENEDPQELITTDIPIHTHLPLFHTKNIVEIPSGFPMFSSARAMLRRDDWTEDDGVAYARYSPKANPNNYVEHYITGLGQIDLLPWDAADQMLDRLGFDAVKLQFVLAAHAQQTARPWEESIYLKGTNIIKDLGWDKRTDKRKSELLLELANTAFALDCLLVKIVWREGRSYQPGVKVSVDTGRMWNIQTRLEGHDGQLSLFSGQIEEPDEIYLQVQPGIWTMGFLNVEGSKVKKALYQYGYIAQNILKIDPYHDELALRIAIFLVTNSRAHTSGKYRVRTLMEEAKSISELEASRTNASKSRNLANQWVSALRLLHSLGWKIEYGETYPDCLRVDYVQAEVKRRPRGYLDLLFNATIMIQPQWQPLLDRVKSNSQLTNRSSRKALPQALPPITGDQIRKARQEKGWTQAQLAARIGVDRSLISYWERGTRIPDIKLEQQLRSLLLM